MNATFLEKLDRDSSMPLYEQVKLRLMSVIALNELTPGTVLPTEKDICEQLGVSRTTVVKALDELDVEGVITRIQGKGTLVGNPKIQIPLRAVRGFSEAMRLQGLAVRSRILSHEAVKPDSRVRAVFGLPPSANAEFVQFQRLRFFQDKPVALVKSTVKKELAEQLLTCQLEDASFYALFEKITGAHVVRNDEIVGITQVNDIQVCNLMQVPLHSFHFQLFGASYREGDIPLEATEAIFHGDVFRFQINMNQVLIRPVSVPVAPLDTAQPSFAVLGRYSESS